MCLMSLLAALLAAPQVLISFTFEILFTQLLRQEHSLLCEGGVGALLAKEKQDPVVCIV